MRNPRYRPADFGDLSLRHEVHVFLYRYASGDPEYLLLRGAPRPEPRWRPAVGPVGWEEDLRQAALRVARRETGVARPADLIAPPTGLLEEVGDLRLIQWPVGLQVAHAVQARHLTESGTTATWCPFREALQALDAPLQRQNLLQLHLVLAA